MIVVVPMAGGDETFKEHGYPFCKPLTEIQDRPLIEHVLGGLRSLGADRHVFVIRTEDARRGHLDEVICLLDPRAGIVQSHGKTAGAACSALLAIEHIQPDRELVIANGDQIFNYDLGNLVREFRSRDLDAGTIVFDSVHPRWSFVRVDEDGLVVEAAEKRPISRHATAGFYYFRRGRDFVQAAKDMIRKNAQVNGAFYVCPTFNEMILRHARIGIHPVPREAYVSLATPQNIEEYEQALSAGRGTPTPGSP